MSSRVVDVHTHFLASALVDALEKRTDLPNISLDADGKKAIAYGEGNIHPMLPAMGDLEMRLREMDEQGIDVAVISLNVPGIDWFPRADGPAIARDVNDEFAAMVAQHPGRLAAMATLPLQVPEAAAAELERAAGLGFRGAMVYSNVAGQSLDAPELRDVWATAARLDLPILIHPTYPLTAKTVDKYALIPTLGFMFDTTTAALKLIFDGLYERHPDFKLIVPHAASVIPYLIGRIDYEAERFDYGPGALTVPPSEHIRRLYADIVSVWPPTIRMLVDLLGADHVMYGSDYPFWDPQRSFDAVAAADLGDEAWRAISSGTADRLFGLEG